MKRLFLFLFLSTASALWAGPTNSILFVTQAPIAVDFTTIGSTFGNHKPTVDSCGRGGDLYIRYPDGTVKNLTRAAGFGQVGNQYPNGIAVREPSVHWSGKKAVFSMVVGGIAAPQSYSTPTAFWQLYEITNFTDPSTVPVITKVPNQPTNFNNVSPIYSSDDHIIFTSDRPRNGQMQLYPQLDEYEEAPTVTGLWSLQPTNGVLFMLNHTPSGAFSPLIDSAGRVVFVRWDHLQRDQQADTDALEGLEYGVFNWSDESSNSIITTNTTEIYPEPREPRVDLLAGTGLTGNTFNQFFPWAIDQDGTDEETVNHVGRHEIGGEYLKASYTNDANLVAQDVFGHTDTTNKIDDFLQIREDPRTPGLFYGIDAPEFGTHSGGQLVSLAGNTNINAYDMHINYLTPRSTQGSYATPAYVPPDDTGFYRNPLMTTDGYMIAAHTTNVQSEVHPTNDEYPTTAFEFRLKFLNFTNGFYTPGTFLTAGLSNPAVYWDPSPYTNIHQTQLFWELDPVEVVARARPTPFSVPIAAPELAAFAAAGVDVVTFQNYLTTHELALIVSRDVTTRDSADHQQPFNLKIAGTTHQTVNPNAPGKIYDIAWLQLFQADQLRSFNYGEAGNPGNGRRVLAQYLHDPAVDNPTPASSPLASVQLGPDGSSAAIVPARRAMTWQLADTNGVGVVRERYWLTFAAGEIRTCTSCHGVNKTDQAGHPAPTNTPIALVQLLNYWKTNNTLKSSVATNQGNSCIQISFIRRPAEPGITYHVQASADTKVWADIATYAGPNIVLTASAKEISRVGTPNETVTVQDTSGIAAHASRFLRINVTRP